ncbi:hypothetical protein K3495_g3312 [Podosphaera aphanis]|nr:hypothetical protein K3495_g3312 [Podosphaera aphanis]
MLRRRLSPKLKDALVVAPDIPDEFHSFVTYLRQKGAGFQEARASSSLLAPVNHYSEAPAPSHDDFSPARTPLTFKEPTVSQGGNAMDLDAISRQKGLDGRLTQQAKDARRPLNRCIWCNRQGL